MKSSVEFLFSFSFHAIIFLNSTELLYNIGKIRKNKVVEVQRSDLVGEVIGSTEQKTKKKLEEARGGVLFVDEAYRLTPSDSPRDFGKNALNEMMAQMEGGDPVMIFAGYPAQMRSFFAANPGLASRINYKFAFPDYQISELAQILKNLAAKRGFTLADVDVSKVLAEHTDNQQRSKQNARLVRNIFEGAIVAHGNRIEVDASYEELFALANGSGFCGGLCKSKRSTSRG